MALQIKLSQVSLSTDGTVLTVQDTTGAYNVSTNPGGYGTPNPATPTKVQLRWKTFFSCVWAVVTGTYAYADVLAGYGITTVSLALSTIPSLFPDGINQVQYLAGYLLTGSVTVLPGSTTVTVVDMDTSKLTAGMYLSFASDPNTLYYILSIASTTIILETPYGGSNTTETCYQWYSTVLNVLVQTLGQNRINDRLCRVTVDNLTDSELNKLLQLTMDELAASARYDIGDYAGADVLARRVASAVTLQPIAF